MRPRDRELGQQLNDILLSYDATVRKLPGIQNPERHKVFIEQLLESIHRVRFPAVISLRNISSRRADPNNELFNPLKAAILHQRNGEIEEAFWLVFLFVHFGKHPRGGWRYAREIYGRLGDGQLWDWATTSCDPEGFRDWLDLHLDDLKRDEVPGGFGNHRKYERLADTGLVVENYVKWVDPPRTHDQLIKEVAQRMLGDPRKTFDELYRSMDVYRFGRTAKFDYFAMIGKLNLAPIEPAVAYMTEATGPLKGARLLFGSDESPSILETWLVELNNELMVGMQVLEDALCNWQKSPEKLRRFRG